MTSVLNANFFKNNLDFTDFESLRNTSQPIKVIINAVLSLNPFNEVRVET